MHAAAMPNRTRKTMKIDGPDSLTTTYYYQIAIYKTKILRIAEEENPE